MASHYNENRVPVLGYTRVLLKTIEIRGGYDLKYYVLNLKWFQLVAEKIFFEFYDLNLGIDLYPSASKL